MTIEQRLQCLERRANRYRNALVLLVMSVCAVGLIGATTDDGIIRAKALIVTNAEGVRVLYAGADTEGDGFLFGGYNKTGQNVVLLYADKSGNGVVDTYIADKILYNSEGKGRTLKPGP